MSEHRFDPRAVDLPALCRHGGREAGAWPLARMTRLAASFSGPTDAVVDWSCHGALRAAAGAESQLWLALSAQAEVALQCQRCLQPLALPLHVRRQIRFVRDEDEAARLDEQSEEDVLALPPRLNLLELLEDELILALPLVPMHEVCPEPLAHDATPVTSEDAEDAAPHPFAALAALRGQRRH